MGTSTKVQLGVGKIILRCIVIYCNMMCYMYMYVCVLLLLSSMIHPTPYMSADAHQSRPAGSRPATKVGHPIITTTSRRGQ